MEMVMRIFDCFTVFQEHEVLEHRLQQWSAPNVIHLAAEGLHTFRGDLKGQEFSSDESRNLIVSHVPLLSTNPKENETTLRNSLGDALEEHMPEPNDLVILSDVDEILRYGLLDQLVELTVDFRIVAPELRFHYYSPYWVSPYGWPNKVKVLRYGTLNTMAGHFGGTITFDQIRENCAGVSVIWDAGWHLSHWGGNEAIHRKMSTGLVHDGGSWVDSPERHEMIKHFTEDGYDIHGKKLAAWDGSDMPWS
jgi:Glycosyltransferase family 17